MERVSLLGDFVLMILIPLVATEKASAKFVFTHFNTDNGEGINNKLYIFILGLLMSQYTLTGYDASARMTEETKNAYENGPKGIISSIGISILVGWGYILGITFAVTNIPNLLSSKNATGGYAIAKIFYQACFQDLIWKWCWWNYLPWCSSRCHIFLWHEFNYKQLQMVYAFSRDGAMPLSKFWHQVNKKELQGLEGRGCKIQCMTHAIGKIFMFTRQCDREGAIPLLALSLGSIVAFQDMVSIATTGLYIAYELPIFFSSDFGSKIICLRTFQFGTIGEHCWLDCSLVGGKYWQQYLFSSPCRLPTLLPRKLSTILL